MITSKPHNKTTQDRNWMTSLLHDSLFGLNFKNKAKAHKLVIMVVYFAKVFLKWQIPFLIEAGTLNSIHGLKYMQKINSCIGFKNTHRQYKMRFLALFFSTKRNDLEIQVWQKRGVSWMSSFTVPQYYSITLYLL